MSHFSGRKNRASFSFPYDPWDWYIVLPCFTCIWMIFMFFHVGKYNGLVPWIHHGLAVLSYHRTAETLSGGPDGRFAWDMMVFWVVSWNPPLVSVEWTSMIRRGVVFRSSKWSRWCFEGSIGYLWWTKSGMWNVGGGCLCQKKEGQNFSRLEGTSEAHIHPV